MREVKRKYKSERKTRIVGGADKIAVKRADVQKPVSEWAVCVTATNQVKFMEKEEFLFAAKRKLAASTNVAHRFDYSPLPVLIGNYRAQLFYSYLQRRKFVFKQPEQGGVPGY